MWLVFRGPADGRCAGECQADTHQLAACWWQAGPRAQDHGVEAEASCFIVLQSNERKADFRVWLRVNISFLQLSSCTVEVGRDLKGYQVQPLSGACSPSPCPPQSLTSLLLNFCTHSISCSNSECLVVLPVLSCSPFLSRPPLWPCCVHDSCLGWDWSIKITEMTGSYKNCSFLSVKEKYC